MANVNRSAEIITSLHNRRLKQLRKMLAEPQNTDAPWVAVEGWKSILDLASRHPPALVVKANDFRYSVAELGATETLILDSGLFQKLSQLESGSGVMAFFEKPYWSWSDIPATLLYLDRLQDPGNLGTLIRTAAAAGQTGLISGPGTVSRFNAKVVRASAGTIFRVPIREGERVAALIENGYRLVAACPDEGESLYEVDLTPPLAVALGNEGDGLAPDIQTLSSTRVQIPVSSGAPSLNAAVAGAIILFEIRRRIRCRSTTSREGSEPSPGTDR